MAGYCPGGSDFFPNTEETFYGLPWITESVILQADGGTVPSVPRWYSVPKSQLLDQPIKWWRCFPVPPTLPSDDILSNYVQGSVALFFQRPGVSDVLNTGCSLDIDWTIQFKDFYDGPSASLMAKEPKAILVRRAYQERLSQLESRKKEELKVDEKGSVVLPPTQKALVTGPPATDVDLTTVLIELEDAIDPYSGADVHMHPGAM